MFDEAHRLGEGGDARFNISGWNSSYTGGPLGAGEMREWVESAAGLVRGLGGSRVLEIGCGTGLLTWRLAPGAAAYTGTDFSAVTLGDLGAALEGGGLGGVRLLHREATDFSGLVPGEFDVAVLNSVCQYFPGAGYLEQVVAGAVGLVAPSGGSVVVGDVRNLVLGRVFHASVAAAGGPCPPGELAVRGERGLAGDGELLVDPRWWAVLAGRLPQVRSVQVLVKDGAAVNEMTKYRYEVVLRTGEVPLVPVRWRDWDGPGPAAGWLQAGLQDGPGRARGVRGVPNPRLAQDLALLGRDGGGDAPSPGRWHELAAAAGARAVLSWAAGDGAGRFDVVFLPGQACPAAVPDIAAVPLDGPGTSDPLAARRARDARSRLAPALRELAGSTRRHRPRWRRSSVRCGRRCWA